MAQVIHVGAWKIKPDVSDAALCDVQQHVIAYKDRIAGVVAAYAGPISIFQLNAEIARVYNVPQDVRWLARGYSYGLHVVFADEAARSAYDSAPWHFALAPLLIPILEGGMDGVLTIDFTLPPA